MWQDRRMWSGAGMGLAAGALWGTVFLAPRLLPEFSPLELTTARYLAYGAVSAALIAPMWPQLRRHLTMADWRTLFWLSGIGNIVYYLFLAASIQFAGMVPASLIVGLLPVTVSLFGQRSVPMAKLPLALIGGGVIGVNLDLIAASDGTPHGALAQLAGVVCAAGALGAWTVYAIGNACYLKQHGRFGSHEWSLLTGVVTGLLAIALVPVVILAMGASAGHGNWSVCLGVMSAIAIGASVIGNGLWNAASRILPPAVFGPMITFETVSALIYGFLYENRWPRPLELLAMALLSAGVLASFRRHAASTSDHVNA